MLNAGDCNLLEPKTGRSTTAKVSPIALTRLIPMAQIWLLRSGSGKTRSKVLLSCDKLRDRREG